LRANQKNQGKWAICFRYQVLCQQNFGKARRKTIRVCTKKKGGKKKTYTTEGGKMKRNMVSAKPRGGGDKPGGEKGLPAPYCENINWANIYKRTRRLLGSNLGWPSEKNGKQGGGGLVGVRGKKRVLATKGMLTRIPRGGRRGAKRTTMN